MPSISQLISALAHIPSIDDEEDFEANTNALLNVDLPTLIEQLNTWKDQANALGAGLNAVATGGALSISYTFSTTTADADPGAGHLRLNNATQSSATVIRTDLLDQAGTDWSAALDLFDDSTSALKGFIKLQKSSDGAKWILFSVSAMASPSGYRNVSVAVVASSTANPFADGDLIELEFTRTGDKGDESWAPLTAWATSTAYTAASPKSVVTQGGSTYLCAISHTSGVFATDLAAGKWVVLAQASGLLGGTMTGALNGAPTVTLASASTVNIGAAAANSLIVTGTTTITAFDTIADGAEREITFAGVLTLTHNATSLILPGAADITTATGDVGVFKSLGSGSWRCVSYLRADGTGVGKVFTGDTGSGGAKGLVPAPAAGDAAANKFLKADGTWAAGGSELKLLSTLTASNSVSLQDTASFTAAYDAYMIILENLLPASSSQFTVDGTTNGGSAWSTIGDVTTPAGASASISGNPGLSGTLFLSNPNNTTEAKTLTGVCNAGNGTYFIAGYTSSFNTALNGLRFKFKTANTTSGKIRIYGIKT